MSNLKNKLEKIIEESLDSILEAAGAHSIANPGAHSIARPGAKSIAPTPKQGDTLADAVGGVEGQLQQAQGQIEQLSAFQQQVAAIAQQDPENPLSAQIMGMLGESVSLREGIIELDIPDVIETLPQQGVQHHHDKHGEGKMANAQLQRAGEDAMWLIDNVDDSQELESWVQAKITKAADYIQSVRNYLEYHKIGNDQLSEEMDERKLKPSEKKKLKSLEKKVPKDDFTDRYGKEGESIYYATLTKMAKK
jgi:hypothetical protein